MRHLPPFLELVAFEAVARHRSFTKAAAELHLTQSAISHRVRRLEKYLGTQLIRRLNPGLVLTESGATLFPELATALDALARLGGKRERRLRVTAGTALCTWWLAGRLAGFMGQRPGLSVELIPRDAPDPTLLDIDVRIHWVAEGEDAASATQAPLFNEQVFPVCSPEILPAAEPLRDAHGLGALTLLHKASNGSGEWSWPVWLDRLGIESRNRRGGELRFADMGLILSAAINGSGVALARSLLACDALQAGRLVVPLADVQPMISTKRHVARWPAEKIGDPDVEAFVRWLVEEAGRTLAETEKLIPANRDVASKAAEGRPTVVSETM